MDEYADITSHESGMFRETVLVRTSRSISTQIARRLAVAQMQRSLQEIEEETLLIRCYLPGVTNEMVAQFKRERGVSFEVLRDLVVLGLISVRDGRLEREGDRVFPPEGITHQRWFLSVVRGRKSYVEYDRHQVPISYIQHHCFYFPQRSEVLLRVPNRGYDRSVEGLYLLSREGVSLLCYGEILSEESGLDEPYTEIIFRLLNDRIEHTSDHVVIDVPVDERFRRAASQIPQGSPQYSPNPSFTYPEYRSRPTPCNGCGNYFGETHGGNTIVCGMHPYGAIGDSCSDWEKE
jgi:hypothetical protein